MTQHFHWAGDPCLHWNVHVHFVYLSGYGNEETLINLIQYSFDFVRGNDDIIYSSPFPRANQLAIIHLKPLLGTTYMYNVLGGWF